MNETAAPGLASSPGRWELGSFAVLGTAAEAQAFCAATGTTFRDSLLPLTFPMRWLVTPAIEAALRGALGDPAFVLVHEAQDFDYTRRLHTGESYLLQLAARRQHAPERLIVEGTIRASDGVDCARLETVLRLLKAPA